MEVAPDQRFDRNVESQGTPDRRGSEWNRGRRGFRCSHSPDLSLKDLRLRWLPTRPGLRVHPYRQSQPRYAGKHAREAGRWRRRGRAMFRNGGNRPCAVAGGTYRLLAARRDRGQFDVAYIDQNDDAALSAALDSSSSLVLIETPSNPLLRIFDIRAIAARAKAAGAKVAVDNTFLSPALQRPIVLGADFVIHSTTKFVNATPM